MPSPTPLLLLLGSGPGIGLSLAQSFVPTHFTRLALCARNPSHLAREKETILSACAGRHDVEIFTFAVDLADLDALPAKLGEIERVTGLGESGGGGLGCVWHNAATVRFGEALGEGVGVVEGDMKTNALSLYTLAQWALPHLLAPRQPPTHPPPSFIATSSHLPETPLPPVLSLSMAKAAQQNLMLCLHEAFGTQVRFGLVKVSGLVSEEDPVLNPRNIARVAVGFWEGGWEGGVKVEIWP